MRDKIVRFIILFLLISGHNAIAQKVYTLLPENSDCSRPIEIKDTIFGPTTAPIGYGNSNEFHGTKADLHSFEMEHNSVWYYFKAKTSGLLRMEIIPQHINDDYDFLLYKYSGKTFCQDVVVKKILPIRSCISRNDKSKFSITGMSDDAPEEFIHSGPGASFCKSVFVQKDQIYYLVLDNVYPNGQGHTVVLHYQGYTPTLQAKDKNKPPTQAQGNLKKPKSILIKIIDKESRYPAKAQVEVYRKINKELFFKTSFDSVTECSLSLPSDSLYLVRFVAHSYFDNELSIMTNMRSDDYVYAVELNKIALDKNLVFNNILFQGGSYRLMPESTPVLELIAATLMRNTEVTIEIQGHVNCPYYWDCAKKTGENQELSFQRAKVVYEYLTKSGVDAKRMTFKGYGASQMLYPDTHEENLMQLNRRVEIKITGIKK